MASLIAQPIDARELEKVTSQWSPDRFASMCDAVVWAVGGSICQSVPSFTNRVLAKDGGIDAEVWIAAEQDSGSITNPLVGPGLNAFQYKKRDLIAQDRRRVISTLKSSLRGALKEVQRQPNQQGKTLTRYNLFLNVDLKGSDKNGLRESILKDVIETRKVQIEIIGAAELAAFINNHPHIRAAYFSPSSYFSTWDGAYESHREKKLLGAHVSLIGRDSDLAQLKSFVDNTRIKVITLTGPHDIGKTRLALEATKHRKHDIVVALDPRSMSLSEYSSLPSSEGEVICLVDDPEIDDLRGIVEQALTINGLKLLITLPTSKEESTYNYGLDERLQSIHLRSLSHEECREVLKAAGFAFDYGIEEWIIDHAAGIPGILLAAASVGNRLRRESTSFSVSVGQVFAGRIQEELGEEVLESANLFSILENTGIRGTHANEVELICDLFGQGRKSHDALLALEKLEKAGLAERRGSFAGISVPLLANYLAGKLLQGHRHEMYALFAKLSQGGQIRFLKRLAQVKQVNGDEVEGFWDEMFNEHGLLGKLSSILERPHLARIVAGTVPKRILSVLEAGLLSSSREERLAITHDQRRELMWALEQLLFRSRTSKGALRLIWLLADAETENYGNNATGVLKESFHPLHPQIPLPLGERLTLINEFVSMGDHKTSMSTAVNAVKGAFSRTSSIRLRRSSGLDPLDSSPPLTYGEIWAYFRSLLEVLLKLAQAEEETAHASRQFLPEAIMEVALQGSPREGIDHFRLLIDWALQEREGIDISQLHWAITRTRESFENQIYKPDFPKDRIEEFQSYIIELDEVGNSLERSSFSIQLKRWAGKFGHSVSSDWNKAYAELDRLGAQACDSPDLLTEHLLNWLLTTSARESRSFFFSLGKRDEARHFLRQVRDLAKAQNGAGAFASYFAGWAERDFPQAEAELDRQANAGLVTGEAIVEATTALGLTDEGVRRIIDQISRQRVPSDFAASLIGIGRRLDNLQPKEFHSLLRAVAGEGLRNSSSVIDLIETWLYHERPLEKELEELAWSCLDQGRPGGSTAAWHFDDLAAKLTKRNPERGFQLLARLLNKQRLIDKEGRVKNLWDPFALDGGEQFWKALYEADKARLYALIVAAAAEDPLVDFHLSWRMRELIQQHDDKEILRKIAQSDIVLARVIASLMTTATPGFWPLAFDLHLLYPNDEELHAKLVMGIEQMGSMIRGPMSDFYRTQQVEVEQVLQEASTPPSVKSWLREVIDRLGSEISSHVVWEYDRDINDLRKSIENKGASDRIWAIGRVLKFADWKDIRRLLSVTDIEETLPQIDLPSEKRKTLEQALSVWRHEK